MKMIAINGSPRKDGNTAVMLENALRGARENGADTRLIHLYDLDFKGCISCFACKRKGNRCLGVCAVNDDLKEVLKDIMASDALILGAPIYFGDVTGEMRSFLERLLFPNLTYNTHTGSRSVFPRKIATAFIYTMNAPEEDVVNRNYGAIFSLNQSLLQLLNGESEVLISLDTYQFDDYSLYDAAKFDVARKARVRAEQFPVACRKAVALGRRLAGG